MMRTTFHKFAVSAAVIAGMGLSTFSFQAAAADVDVRLDTKPTSSRTVRYNDLDLNKMEDAKELYKRISRAAGSVCRDTREIHNLRTLEIYKYCVQTAIDNAVTDVDNYNLAAVHGERGPAFARR